MELTPAIILHRRPWRDSSQTLEILSREHGRIGLIAKGARRATTRWRGQLEPLTRAQLSWSGRGELKTLTGVDAAEPPQLSGNRLWGALYASELTLRLTAREDPLVPLHDSLADLLQSLSQGMAAVVAVRFFERDLLQAIGYGLPLTNDPQTGEPVSENAVYAWHPIDGLMPGPARGQALAVPGRVLTALASGRFASREDVHAARRLLGAALKTHLGQRPLKTLQTMKAMRQFETLPSAGKTQ